MKIKRYIDFLKLEGYYINASGKIRSDSDLEEGFNHSPRAERLLMFIEDIYKDLHIKTLFNNILNKKYDITIISKDIYSELATAIRDKIIPEIDLENLLEEIEKIQSIEC